MRIRAGPYESSRPSHLLSLIANDTIGPKRDARRAKAHGEAPPPFAMRGVGLSRGLSIVPPPSATRLPPSWRGPWALRPRLAAGLPLSRCQSAIALVKTIVLTWSPPAYMPDGHLSRGRLASFLYARRLFLRMNFVELRYSRT